MKSLWLARLARPDILRPINELATRVQRWTRADDKKVLRLIQYLQASMHYRLLGYIGNELDDVRLRHMWMLISLGTPAMRSPPAEAI